MVLAADLFSSPSHAAKKNGASLASSGEHAALEEAEISASSGTDAGRVTLFCSLTRHACPSEPFFPDGERGVEAAPVSDQAMGILPATEASTRALLAGVPRLLVGAWRPGTASCTPAPRLPAAAQLRDTG